MDRREYPAYALGVGVNTFASYPICGKWDGGQGTWSSKLGANRRALLHKMGQSRRGFNAVDIDRIALRLKPADNFNLFTEIWLGLRLVVQVVAHFGYRILQDQLTLFHGDASREAEGLWALIGRGSWRHRLLLRRFWGSCGLLCPGSARSMIFVRLLRLRGRCQREGHQS